MRVLASAPGKICLYGEHAVVYKKPAIVASIDKRVYVTCETRNDDRVTIRAVNLEVPGITITYDRNGEVIFETDYGVVLSATSYIREAITVTSEYLGVFKGVDLKIESTMPVGAGLGTSAAVSVASIAAYSKALGFDLSRDEIAKLAWETEKKVQGLASPMDTSISTFGGIIYLKYGDNGFQIENLDINVELPIVVGYTKRLYKTKDMVAKVKMYKDKYPDLINPIIETIGRLVDEAKIALIEGDLIRAGELMNINHGLLDALGVSTKELNDMVYAARAFGAYGSKLSGAGGGGVVIALARRESIPDIITAFKMLNTIPIETTITAKGVDIKVLSR